MNKLKIIVKKTGKYLREISVVVIGVAITLFASYWISIKSEKRDMALYLNALKMELEENMKVIDDVKEYSQPSVRYANYLKSHDKKSLNADTIKSYTKVFYTVQSFTFKTNAFEMFKTSGIMRLVDDKELLLSIWDVYNNIDILQKFLDRAYQEKYDEMKKEVLSAEQGKSKMKDAPMHFFYATTYPVEMLRASEEILKQSKEVVLKLESTKP